jgi:hypothetical protein
VCLTDQLLAAGATDVDTIEPEKVGALVSDRALSAMGLENEITSEADAPGGEVRAAVQLPDGRVSRWIGTPSPISDAALDELRRFESELWQADVACQETAGLRTVQVQIESEFVSSLAADFPSMAAAG